MARLIVKSPYIKCGGGNSAGGYMRYIATRERVELIQDDRPPTRKQEQLIAKLVKDFPDARELDEYGDYQEHPTKAIAEQRNKKGLKQRELADMLSIKRETVNQWENGIRQIKGEDIARLADALGTTTDYILRGIKSENLSVAKETGLSDGAVTTLRQLSKAGERPGECGVYRYGYKIETLSVLSDLIESNHFHELFNNIALYLISAEVLPDEAYESAEHDLTVEEYSRFYGWAKGRGLEVITRDAAKELYLQKACDVLKDICKEMLESGKHSREKK